MPSSRSTPPPPVPLGDLSTRELLREARDGNEEALNALFERARGPLKRWARGRFPQWARGGLDTEDLVNEALAGTFRNLETFDPRHEGAFHNYLCKAVANRIRTEIQKSRGRVMVAPPGGQLADPRLSPEEEAAHAEAFARYEAALGRLHEEAREAVRMRLDLGYSYDEIARELGKPSANAARMVISRAIAKLAREMDHGR